MGGREDRRTQAKEGTEGAPEDPKVRSHLAQYQDSELPWMSPNPINFIGFGAMDVTKPYESISFGAMGVTKLINV